MNSAYPLVLAESCEHCDGLGIVDISLPGSHPADAIERTCSLCSGSGRAPIELHLADDDDARVTHAWSSVRSYDREEPAVCDANPLTVSHESGRFALCPVCAIAVAAVAS